jgi:hypothetical protein
MGLLTKHPTNSIALKSTSTPFLGNKHKKGKEKPVAMKVYDTPPNSLKDSNASSESENNTRSWGMYLSLYTLWG